ncbi:Ribosomal protein S17E [Methanocella conradii HZ254]|uniref:Small ribosomal subunit protein eS17 n=1 Tax=Methanocella conradii (strain DSM 24694 / JCM 17849 / CGMCC 1.5162 / HZ254) TaxID=1041930 RepID=H8I491_METCZ|nr:30S ribosomal protein S17e [Methanocella conradii]AFC99230.1 Ribosomal protein S17E [Methanocella conradii HZ254]MDI6897767.1 30S ribosomal protein S17e [Methanocella conradii]
MGSIRQTYIKSTVDALLRQYPGEFSEDFNANKAQVEKLTGVASKELRNRIAGYVTRKVHSRGRRK